MRRSRHNRSTLRGSVTQNTVRMRPKEKSRFRFLIRLSALAGSVVIVLCIAIWLWHIGWPQREAEHMAEAGLHMTQKASFSVKDIIVEGRQQTSKDVLLATLGTGTGAPILGFDAAAAQDRIAKLPWVSSVAVERRLPDTILVRLTERVPLARWQHDGRTVVIDNDGNTLPDVKPESFAQLPMVVGADAPAETATLLNALKNYPAVTEKMVAAVRVSERRWDLHLQPKIIARLPEHDIDVALSRLSQLITDEKILDRNIVAIDLRLPDRFSIEPAAGGTPATHTTGDMRL